MTKANQLIIVIILLLVNGSCRNQNHICATETCFDEFLKSYTHEEGIPDIVYYSDTTYHRYVAMKIHDSEVSGRLGLGCNASKIKTYYFTIPRKYIIDQGFTFIRNSDSLNCTSIKIKGVNGVFEERKLTTQELNVLIAFRSSIDSVWGEVPDWWAWEMKQKLEQKWDIKYYDLDMQKASK